MTARTLPCGGPAAWTLAGFPLRAGASGFRPGPRTHPTWPAQPVRPGHNFTHNTFRAMAAAPPGQEGATRAPHSTRAGTAPPRFRRPRYPLPAPQDPAPSVSRKPQPCIRKTPPPIRAPQAACAPPRAQCTAPPLTRPRKKDAFTLYPFAPPRLVHRTESCIPRRI